MASVAWASNFPFSPIVNDNELKITSRQFQPAMEVQAGHCPFGPVVGRPPKDLERGCGCKWGTSSTPVLVLSQVQSPCNGYTAMDFFCKPPALLCPSSALFALGSNQNCWSCVVSRRLWVRFSTFSSQEELFDGQHTTSMNPNIMKKESKVEIQQLQETYVSQWASMSWLLIYHEVNESASLIYAQ